MAHEHADPCTVTAATPAPEEAAARKERLKLLAELRREERRRNPERSKILDALTAADELLGAWLDDHEDCNCGWCTDVQGLQWAMSAGLSMLESNYHRAAK